MFLLAAILACLPNDGLFRTAEIKEAESRMPGFFAIRLDEKAPYSSRFYPPEKTKILHVGHLMERKVTSSYRPAPLVMGDLPEKRNSNIRDRLHEPQDVEFKLGESIRQKGKPRWANAFFLADLNSHRSPNKEQLLARWSLAMFEPTVKQLDRKQFRVSTGISFIKTGEVLDAVGMEERPEHEHLDLVWTGQEFEAKYFSINRFCSGCRRSSFRLGRMVAKIKLDCQIENGVLYLRTRNGIGDPLLVFTVNEPLADVQLEEGEFGLTRSYFQNEQRGRSNGASERSSSWSPNRALGRTPSRTQGRNSGRSSAR